MDKRIFYFVICHDLRYICWLAIVMEYAETGEAPVTYSAESASAVGFWGSDRGQCCRWLGSALLDLFRLMLTGLFVQQARGYRVHCRYFFRRDRLCFPGKIEWHRCAFEHHSERESLIVNEQGNHVSPAACRLQVAASRRARWHPDTKAAACSRRAGILVYSSLLQ